MRIRGVAGDKVIILKFRGNDPALFVVLLDPDTIADRNRLLPAKDRRSGIAFFFGVVPVLIVALQIEVDLPLLKLCFLQTNRVSVDLAEKIHKALCDARAKSVYIPRNKFFHNHSPISVMDLL